ncbi:unnamed protein product [Rotaria sp. Silwood1]|nr:unnamed protein product [Rotaria sp. Silwood1]CAF5106457.1 unnamed protein product [Rotaria sp. Silwood1]
MLVVSRKIKPPQPGSRPPEDIRMMSNNKISAESTSPDKFDRAARINGAISNDSENDAYFLILYLGTAIFAYSVNADILRDSLIENDMFDLIETKHSKHHEMFRRNHLTELGLGDNIDGK